MTHIARPRRFACAGIALALSLLVLHAQLADALVTRGDDAYRSGDIAGALRSYARALRFDSASRTAADRLAFLLALRHDAAAGAAAIDVATAGLRYGDDAALLADRGLAEMQLHRWKFAADDFSRAGRLARDARYDHFAARMALRSGDRAGARADTVRALRDDAHFAPARGLLRSLE